MFEARQGNLQAAANMFEQAGVLKSLLLRILRILLRILKHFAIRLQRALK
jgi:hypothetical protein